MGLRHLSLKKYPGRAALALLLVLYAAVPAAAFYYYKRFVPLVDVRNTGARGEALIEPYGSRIPGERTIGVDAYHLRPNSVYTVWLSGPDKLYGNEERYSLGPGVNSFRTDGSGNGRYVTTVNEYDLRHWRFIEVDYHPDNDPKNTKGMITVLKGDMIYGFHT